MLRMGEKKLCTLLKLERKIYAKKVAVEWEGEEEVSSEFQVGLKYLAVIVRM